MADCMENPTISRFIALPFSSVALPKDGSDGCLLAIEQEQMAMASVEYAINLGNIIFELFIN